MVNWDFCLAIPVEAEGKKTRRCRQQGPAPVPSLYRPASFGRCIAITWIAPRMSSPAPSKRFRAALDLQTSFVPQPVMASSAKADRRHSGGDSAMGNQVLNPAAGRIPHFPSG